MIWAKKMDFSFNAKLVGIGHENTPNGFNNAVRLEINL